MQTNCYIDFDDILKENLKDPEFKKGYKKETKRFNLELKLNEMLQAMGIKDMFVEVKDMDEY
jgi:hypothetical protein